MNASLDDRVLVLMPSVRDGERTGKIFTDAGFVFTICNSFKDLCCEIRRGAGVALLTEEAVTADTDGLLSACLGDQPAWSDFPLIVLAREGSSGAHIRETMNATLVERPVKFRSLLSVVRSSLRARRHQLAVRDHLADQKKAEESLKKMASDLSETDRRKDEFLSILAHELRNPLAPIRTGLQLMEYATDDKKVASETISMMKRQVTLLVRLVDDLMDVSRITRGIVELRFEKVSLDSVINSAVETSRPLLNQMGHKLRITLPSPPAVLNADLTRLAQVFMNLLNNAAKYSEPEGLIQLDATIIEGHVLISVRDTGIGIPPDKLTSIFEMFSQVDRTLENARGGLGIGLTLVKRLVEMHGGSIQAKSDGIGKGSEFVVQIPIVEQTCSQITAKDGEASQKTSLRVLVVDDNRDGADTLGMMLQAFGNETLVAYDGQEGVELAERQKPDVILFDIGLPRLNGYDACRKVRETVWGKSITIIAVTGWGQEEDRRRSSEAGFDHHIVKPVAPDVLLKLLLPVSPRGNH